MWSFRGIRHKYLCNTPTLPVKNPRLGLDGKIVYRFVQDLQAMNKWVTVPQPVVPDPSTMLWLVPSGLQ